MILTELLHNADPEFARGNVMPAFEALVAFGQVVFAIEPFKPDDLVGNWTDILRAWLNGQSMADLAGDKDAQMLEFIEQALVYRLVWALEAIRVRGEAVSGIEKSPNAGRAALAVETGTSNICAALLIQNGLSSRVAAMSAVRDCPARFSDIRGLRAWLNSAPVLARQRDPTWPTLETASLWHRFIKGLENPTLRKWNIHGTELPVSWESAVPKPGSKVRVLYDSDRRETIVYSVDLERLGTIEPGFPSQPPGVILATVTLPTNFLSVEYLGPSDLRYD